jgi:uncharacterized membrane protein YqiK
MDRFQEEMDAEFNGQFDAVREAFAATAEDCNEMARQDAEAEAREFAEFIGPRRPFVFDEIPF